MFVFSLIFKLLHVINYATKVITNLVVSQLQVHFHKHDTEDLGMAILGGKEYGLPIMISEIFPDSAVSRCAKIGAGDM